jgi:CheY-like chemotaxis protein
MDLHAPTPRVLLAEDDPVSARFLAEALALLGATVEVRADGPSALAAATASRYDLLLLDLGLPGLDGGAVLRALRADAGAASRHARAVATSAGVAPMSVLEAAGFEGLLRKPATLDAIAAMLGQRATAVGEPPAGPDAPVLDDAAALAALGSMDAVADLRGLLAAELPAQRASLRRALAAGDAAAARTVLHRLHASTRFCGAAALAAAGSRLQHALEDRADAAHHATALAALEAAADAYLRELSR